MSFYDQQKILSDLRVGILSFAALSLIVLGVILAGGDKGLIFKKTSSLKAWLSDVGGLKKGSAVTMGGMTIGKVTEINFTDGSEQSFVEVKMEVREDLRRHIKEDSVPSVRTQGMLGDRYVEISMGNKNAPPLETGEPLVGKSATDFDDTLREAQKALTETTKLLSTVNTQRGNVGQLVYDEKLYQGLTAITEQLNELIEDFKKHPRKYIKFSLF